MFTDCTAWEEQIEGAHALPTNIHSLKLNLQIWVGLTLLSRNTLIVGSRDASRSYSEDVILQNLQVSMSIKITENILLPLAVH